MDLYKEILVSVLSKETIRIDVPFLKFSPYEIVEIECYRLLKNIKEILEDDSLCDIECFQKIEAIINEFEKEESSIGLRHDFG